MRYRGLGAVNVEPLAQAFMDGQFSPSFNPTLTWQPAYMAPGQTSTLPEWVSMTDSAAGQMASLLGGSVVKGPVTGYQFADGSVIPEVDYIDVEGQQFLPGNVFQPGSILSFEDICAAENYLVSSIPGGAFGPLCGSGVSTPNPFSTPNPPAPTPVVTTPVAVTPAPVATPITQTPAPRAVTQITQPVTTPPASAQVVIGTPGANVNSSTGTPAASSSDIVIGGFDLSTLPWYVWAGGAALLFFALMPKGGH